MPSITEAIQAKLRSITGTAFTYEGDWHAFLDTKGVPAGMYCERILNLAAQQNPAIKTYSAAINWFADTNNITATNLQGDVITYLQSVVGSLWVVAPGNLYSYSNKTVPAVEGSNVGYVSDLAGTKPALQASATGRPLLMKAPTKLGPELVLNGDFTTNTDNWTPTGNWWDGTAPDLFAINGELAVVNIAAVFGAATQTLSLTVGKKYFISGYGYSMTGLAWIADSQGLAMELTNTNDRYSYSFICNAPDYQISLRLNNDSANNQARFSHISVREILEEAWVLQFDGIDDVVATAALPAPASETIIVAGMFDKLNATVQGMAWKRSGNTGMNITKNALNATEGVEMTGAVSVAGTLRGTEAVTPAVYTLSYGSGKSLGRLNGVQMFSATQPYTSSGTGLFLGADGAADFMRGQIFGVVYAPVAVPADKMLMIEKYLGSLCGVTI